MTKLIRWRPSSCGSGQGDRACRPRRTYLRRRLPCLPIRGRNGTNTIKIVTEALILASAYRAASTASSVPQFRACSDLPIICHRRGRRLDRVPGSNSARRLCDQAFSPRSWCSGQTTCSAPIVRRSHPPSSPRAIEFDADARIHVSPGTVPLATREFDLLQYLCENQGRALSRRQLLDGVWGLDWIGDDRTVDVHVRQLRKKFGDALPLDTVWGVGYRMG